VLIIPKFVEQPLGDPVLLLGRKGGELRDNGVKRPSHDVSIPPAVERPNKPLERPGMNALRPGERVCAGH